MTNSFVVSRGAQTITFATIGDQVLGNPPVSLSASSSSGLRVLFQLVSGPATLTGNSLTFLSEGTVVVRAFQVGSPVWLAAQVEQSFVVRKRMSLTLLVAENTVLRAGETVTVQVLLQGMTNQVYGASFQLAYPTNALWLANVQAQRLGTMVPPGAVALWNVAPAQSNYQIQAGSVALVVSNATAWPSSNGVLAELSFQVQAGVTQQTLWPVTLTQGAALIDGFQTQGLPDTSIALVFKPLEPVPAQLNPTASGLTKDGFKLVFQGAVGGKYVVQSVDTLLGTWSDLSPVLTASTAPLEYLDRTSKPSRFYRVRWASP